MRCIEFCLAMMIFCSVDSASSGRGMLDQPLVTWESGFGGDSAGQLACKNGAKAGPFLVTRKSAYRGVRSASFEIDLSNGASSSFQAEDAVLVGSNPGLTDSGASGGRFVGEFGEKAGDAILFDEVPDANELTVFYTNGTGSPKQCSLYVDGKNVATLNFPDTPTWWSPFYTVTYKGTVKGSVKLQVDPDDLEVNKVFCCNVDKIVVGRVTEPPSATISIALGETKIRPGMRYLGFALRGPKLLNYTVEIEDVASVTHMSKLIHAEKDNQWEYATLWLDDFQPKLDSGLRSITLRCSSESSDIKGTVYIDELGLFKGWPSNPPVGCPLAKSEDIVGVSFTGRHKAYTEADTWYPSWASDGNMYSPFTDGFVEGVFARSDNPDANTGMARIEGDDPLNLKVSLIGLYTSRPWPYITRYPCGSLVRDGVWYYGTYIINGDARPDGLNTFLGPFVGFRSSTDYGKTWTETPCTPLHNLFGEVVDKASGGYSKIKMGAPHFVDFGRNMEHSPDGKAYLVAHGCTRPDSMETWIRGDQIYLARVAPTPANINDIANYEFFAGHGKNGKPVWSRKFSEIKPLYDWTGRTGCVTMTYNAPLRKYVMCVTSGESTVSVFDTSILESSSITGPWKLVTYMEQFGTQAYFVNIPSKFISPDGRKMWLCYSANWTGHKANLPDSKYAMCLQEMELITADRH